MKYNAATDKYVSSNFNVTGECHFYVDAMGLDTVFLGGYLRSGNPGIAGR